MKYAATVIVSVVLSGFVTHLMQDSHEMGFERPAEDCLAANGRLVMAAENRKTAVCINRDALIGNDQQQVE